MKNDNVFYVDSTYLYFRKLWREDRWQFSGELVKLTLKENKSGLNNEEQHAFDTMTRIIKENEGKWLDNYNWQVEGLKKVKAASKEKEKNQKE